MASKNFVTQGELGTPIQELNALQNNLDEHVNQSLTKGHGWNILDSTYLDIGGNYQTDFGQTGGVVAIPGIYNTGVNNDGTLAALNTVDSHWTLILSADSKGPGPSVYVCSPISSSWATDGPKSQWICPVSNGNTNLKVGSYKYRLTFNLSGLNPTSAVIQGSWTSDNGTTSILLNNVATGFSSSTGNYGSQPGASPNKFSINSGFVVGQNTLDFLVNNAGGATGLRVEITGTASAGGVSKIPLFNTGVNSDGSLATKGGVDQHWTLIQSAAPANPGPHAIIILTPDGNWAKNTTTAQWIGPIANANGTNPGLGTYVYRQSFDMTGLNPASAVIKGSYRADDKIQKILLNGVDTGFTNNSPYNTLVSFVISSGFQTGINTLDFVLINTVLDTGIIVTLSGTAAPAGTNFTPRVLRLNIGNNIFYVPCQESGGIDGTPDAVIPVFSGIVSPQSADPATDLTTGSPTPAQLVTTFSDLLNSIASASSATLTDHAGGPGEDVHSGLSWQAENVINTSGYIVGTRTINILINGVSYKIVGDINITGPT